MYGKISQPAQCYYNLFVRGAWRGYFTLILVIATTIFLVISVCYEYHPYQSFTGIVMPNENEYFVHTFVPIDQLEKIGQRKLILDHTPYSYEVKEIGNEIFDGENSKKYREVVIVLSLPEDLKQSNQIISFTVEQPKTTLFQVLLQQLKKGLQT